MRILLDTCTFLWMTLDAPALSQKARQLLADPGHEIYLSAISAWEIGVKYSTGRLPLPNPPAVFVPTQRQALGLIPLIFGEPAALLEAGLPRIHKDPFDRALICQAIIENLILLTPDPAIRRYPVVRTEW